MNTVMPAAALVLCATICQAQTLPQIEAPIDAQVQASKFLGAVLVARGAEVILSRGYGLANIEWQVANTPSTKFRLGSITKQFTGASILLLEERGKLKITDTIKTHLPDAPATWDGITIQHLLTHTAGVPNFTEAPDYRSTMTLATTPEQLIARFRDKPLDFAPGSKMSYSNSGYVLLGAIVEKVSGVRYATFLNENLFSPAGMKDSGYDSNTVVIPRRASGYVSASAGLENASFLHMTIPFSAGALYSTAEDLLRWNLALFGGKILSPASLEKMTTPSLNNYALGVVVWTVKDRKIVQHNGGISGFNTFLSYYPASRVTVAVLANLNGPAADLLGAQLGWIAHEDAARP
jgi:CubicO group peptidase (beta-lactamase class C family)